MRDSISSPDQLKKGESVENYQEVQIIENEFEEFVPFSQSNDLGSVEELEPQIAYQRRDPEEEYFMLAVLAHKMTHTEDFDADHFIYEVNA